MDFFDMEVLLKLGVSAVLGLVLGLERELKRKPIGLKTSLVISLVSCLLTMVSIDSAYRATAANPGVNITMDPLRLAAQIVSGIGFLGAGAILRRGNDSISGLTTAAIIWGAAGIGIAVGAGFYFEATAGVILIMISLEIIPLIMTLIGPRQLKEKDFKLDILVIEQIHVTSVIDAIQQQKYSVHHVRIRDLKDGSHLIQLHVGVNFKGKITDIYHSVSKIDGVNQVEIESL